MRHRLTGEPKYPEGFPHFDYVNPDAPKGGVLRLAFDTAATIAQPDRSERQYRAGTGLIYETLMTSSLDELNINAEYGLIAEAIAYPPDFSSVSLPAAAGGDAGTTGADHARRRGLELRADGQVSPYLRGYYSHVKKAEQTGEREVTFTFDGPGNRELPHIMGQLQVYPQHWWEGKDAQGTQRDISKTTLEPPLGSGSLCDRIVQRTAT